jgi:Homeodomain-like domain
VTCSGSCTARTGSGLRLVMILLSQHGWTAGTIAELLGCDPRTVRRWVHRYDAYGQTRWPTGPDPAGHAWVAGG